jgi:hypothetical protein
MELTRWNAASGRVFSSHLLRTRPEAGFHLSNRLFQPKRPENWRFGRYPWIPRQNGRYTGMLRRCRLIFILLGLIIPVLSQGAADWTKLKTGIMPTEAAEVLGKPLIRTYGRGFQLWIYDGAGEIVFGGGPALGWTVPAPTAESLARPVALDVLIRPVVRLPALRSLNPQRQTYEDPFDTRFRYKR